MGACGRSRRALVWLYIYIVFIRTKNMYNKIVSLFGGSRHPPPPRKSWVRPCPVRNNSSRPPHPVHDNEPGTETCGSAQSVPELQQEISI